MVELKSVPAKAQIRRFRFRMMGGESDAKEVISVDTEDVS
jgi:hypothetical protein